MTGQKVSSERVRVGDNSSDHEHFLSGEPPMSDEELYLVDEVESETKGVLAPKVGRNEDQWVKSTDTLYPLEGGYDGAERDWNGLSRRVWLIARLGAFFLLFALLVGWPIGDVWAHRSLYGTASGWSILGAYPPGILLFALVVPILMLFGGYLLSRSMTTTEAAEAIANAARQYTQPNQMALQEVAIVGTAVRTQMDVLNDGLDKALMRLADVEATIRKHVDAIETAGLAIETRTVGAMDKVASERTRLIDLTENLNKQADNFANAIAERTEANLAAMNSADSSAQNVEDKFDVRLGALETASTSAINSFRQLVDALGDGHKIAKDNASAMQAAAEHALKASEQTQQATQEARKATEEAVQQSLLDATSDHHRETVEKALELTRDQVRAQALEIARKEAENIAQAAVGSATNEIEKLAKHAGHNLQLHAEQARAQSEHAEQLEAEAAKAMREAAALRKEELTKTHEALMNENSRLEALIVEQQQRAERLASAIAVQSEKMNRLVEEASNNQSADILADKLAERDETASLLLRQQETTPTQLPQEASIDQNSPNINDNPTEEAPLRVRIGGVNGQADERDLRKPKPLKPAIKKSGPQDPPSSVKGEEPAAIARNDLHKLNDLARDLAEKRSTNRAARQASQSIETPKSPGEVKSEKPDGQMRSGNQAPSWKEILAAADDAQPISSQDTPHTKDDDELLLTPKDHDKIGVRTDHAGNVTTRPDGRESKAIRVINRLQQFTYNLDVRLYGDVPQGLIERFNNGERNVFADRLLRLNEGDVKRRIRLECAKDKRFEEDVRQFLVKFDGLLEDAAKSSDVDEELRAYLGSPLGRIYLLIGEIVGYFA